MVHGAVLFQAAWRSKRGRLRRGFAARKIQVAWAVAFVKQIPVRDEAAACIQALFRGHVCRLWLGLNEATTKITAVYRGHAARLKVDQIRGRLRKFWAHLLFSNEANGLPDRMTSRMIELGDGDSFVQAEKQKSGVALSGFLASPDRHAHLVPAVWSKYPVQKEHLRTLAGGRGCGSDNGSSGARAAANLTIPVPVFNSPGRKSMSWVRSEGHVPKRKVPKATKLPAFAIQKQPANRSVMREVVNPTAPRLFANTTISSGWSSLHAIYVMPPEEERPARPPSAAVERLSYLARELPFAEAMAADNESMDISEEDGYAQYDGYAGVYASGGGGSGGGSYGSSYGSSSEWGEFSQPISQETLARPKQSALRGKVQFPTPNVGLRERKRLLGRALGRDTAKEGSAAHVLVHSGDMGLVQSFMKLRAGGRAARSMISGKTGSGGGGTKKKRRRRRRRGEEKSYR